MTTRAPSRPDPTTRADVISLAFIAAGFAIALLLIAPVLEVPPQVERITIDNPYPWPAHIDVSQPGDSGWLGVGTVDQTGEQDFRSIIDQGDAWIVRFSYAGHHVEHGVTRRQLEADDWHITVPDDFARQLRDAGLPEAPP